MTLTTLTPPPARTAATPRPFTPAERDLMLQARREFARVHCRPVTLQFASPHTAHLSLAASTLALTTHDLDAGLPPMNAYFGAFLAFGRLYLQ